MGRFRMLAMTFTRDEINALLAGWFSVSLAFGILYGGVGRGFLSAFALSCVTVGAGFLLHELGHKFVAQRFGCAARFHAFRFMLVLMVALSFFGFVFAAPGAVMIRGVVDRRAHGLISVAGPLVNVFLAILFFLIGQLGDPFATLGQFGFAINSWLGLFNMLPFFGLDGAKVLAWHKGVYGLVFGAALLLVFLS